MPLSGNARVTGARAVSLLFWASSFAGIRAGLHDYTPGQVALLRCLVASGVLAAYALLTRMRLPARRDLPGIALLGLAGIAVYHTVLNQGEVSVQAGTASLLLNTGPIFTALLAMVLLGERLRLLGWAGIALSFLGVALIVLGQAKGLRLDTGAPLILLAAMLLAVSFVLQKPYLRHYGAVELTSYAFWSGTLFLLVFLPGLSDAVRHAPLSTTLAMGYLGIFSTALANITWAYALARTPASNAASLLYILPLLAIGVAWIWLGELPSALSLLGGGVALAGVVLVSRRGRHVERSAGGDTIAQAG